MSLGTVTRVASSITTVTLLAANSNRLTAIIVNDSSSVLYVKMGTGASATDYTYKMAAGETRELPVPSPSPTPRRTGTLVYSPPVGYTGVLTGVWVTANGAAQITELV